MRAAAAEQVADKLRAELEAMKLGGRPGSTSSMRAAAAERETSKLRAELAKKDALLKVGKERDSRASVDKLKDIRTALFKSFQLDLLFVVDVTGSMQDTIDMVGLSM